MVSFTVFRGSKEGSIVEGTTTREIREDEVLVKVTHSGVCGTDEHRRHTDMVLGHEGVGIIEVSGSSLAPKIVWLLIISVIGNRKRRQKPLNRRACWVGIFPQLMRCLQAVPVGKR
jgi:NADPH:quinone reductase-like Zn-dependent oxidoreductase